MKSDPIQPWRTLSSRQIVADRWMQLRADACATEAGVVVDPFYVIESPDFVAAVAITAADELVLARQYRHAYGATTLELPAGLRDKGEDPVIAALRELREETGYVGRDGRLLRSWSPMPGRYANQMHAVLVQGAELTANAEEDPVEQIQTVLWPLSAVDQLWLHPEFANSSQAGVLAVALADRRGRTR